MWIFPIQNTTELKWCFPRFCEHLIPCSMCVCGKCMCICAYVHACAHVAECVILFWSSSTNSPSYACRQASLLLPICLPVCPHHLSNNNLSSFETCFPEHTLEHGTVWQKDISYRHVLNEMYCMYVFPLCPLLCSHPSLSCWSSGDFYFMLRE